jgi:hypothetical protein
MIMIAQKKVGQFINFIEKVEVVKRRFPKKHLDASM